MFIIKPLFYYIARAILNFQSCNNEFHNLEKIYLLLLLLTISFLNMYL